VLKALPAVVALLLVSGAARLEEPKLVQVPPAADEIQKDSTGTKAHPDSDSQLAVTCARKGETTPNNVDDDTDDPKQNKHHTDWALFWATIGLAVVTAGLDVLVLLQLRLAQNTDKTRSKQMDDTLAQMKHDEGTRIDFDKQRLRAYVFPEAIHVIRPQGGYPPFYGPLYIRIKNFGHTPAYRVTTCMLSDVAAYPWKPETEPTPTFNQYKPLAPQGIVEMGFSDPRRIPDELFRPFHGRKAAIWVLLWIEYDDAFGQHHKAFYRWYHQANFLTGESMTVGQMRPDGDVSTSD
jgi:hypothetical protein